MDAQSAKESINELSEALAIDEETRRLAFAVHGVYILQNDIRNPDIASAVAAMGLACQLHNVPLSINDIARPAAVDPADAERAYHRMCDQLPYRVCDEYS